MADSTMRTVPPMGFLGRVGQGIQNPPRFLLDPLARPWKEVWPGALRISEPRRFNPRPREGGDSKRITN